MEYTTPLYLVSHTDSTDEYGNVVRTETQRLIFCKVNNVGTREFYNALAVGLTPSYEIQIRNSNYEGEDEVILNGNHYSVIRTISKKKLDVVLVLGEKSGTNQV